jgi:pilus assembly protein Flp/PilA
LQWRAPTPVGAFFICGSGDVGSSRNKPKQGAAIYLRFTKSVRPILSIEAQVPSGEPVEIRCLLYQEVGMEKLFSRFLADQSAATAIEYGLIAAGISLAIIAAVNGLGSNLHSGFTTLNNSLK